MECKPRHLLRIRPSRRSNPAPGTAARANGRRDTRPAVPPSESAGYRGPDAISAAVGCRDHVGTRASDKGQHCERGGEASRNLHHLFRHFPMVFGTDYPTDRDQPLFCRWPKMANPLIHRLAGLAHGSVVCEAALWRCDRKTQLL